MPAASHCRCGCLSTVLLKDLPDVVTDTALEINDLIPVTVENSRPREEGSPRRRLTLKEGSFRKVEICKIEVSTFEVSKVVK